MKPLIFKEIQNKLSLNRIKGNIYVELKVNDMRIKAAKSNITRKWNVSVYHEEKDVHDNHSYTNKEFINYLNAYIETARTPIFLGRDSK